MQSVTGGVTASHKQTSRPATQLRLDSFNNYCQHCARM